MTHSNNGQTPPDLLQTADLLRQRRPEATALRLDEIKRDVLQRRGRRGMRGSSTAGRVKQLLAGARAVRSGRHALVGRAELSEMKRAFQIDFLKSVGLRPGHYLLDVGCGTLRGGIPLIQHLEPGHYYGLEVRAEVLDEGCRELEEAGLAHKEPVLIHAQDLSAVALGQRFDIVWAFSVLIHMTDEIADACLALVARQLAPDGSFFANVNIGERTEGRWQGFPVVRRPHGFYEQLAERNGLRVADLGTLRELGHISGKQTADAQAMLRFVPG